MGQKIQRTFGVFEDSWGGLWHSGPREPGSPRPAPAAPGRHDEGGAGAATGPDSGGRAGRGRPRPAPARTAGPRMAARPTSRRSKLQDDPLVRAEDPLVPPGGAETLEQLDGLELKRYLAERQGRGLADNSVHECLPYRRMALLTRPFAQSGGHRQVHRSPRPSNVEIRADDPALTGHAGLLLTGELATRTDLVARLDRAIGAVRPFKQRRRGRSGGELLVSLAEMMAVGGDHLVHLEELREDDVGAELRAVGEVLAPTTAGQLMRRLNARQCQAAVTDLAKIGEEVDRELGLTTEGPVTLSLTPGESRMASSGHLARPHQRVAGDLVLALADDHHAVVGPDLDPVAGSHRVARRAESHRLQPADLTLFRAPQHGPQRGQRPEHLLLLLRPLRRHRLDVAMHPAVQFQAPQHGRPIGSGQPRRGQTRLTWRASVRLLSEQSER